MKFNENIFIILFIIGWVVLRSHTYTVKKPVINTKYGPVVGLTEFSRKSREFMSFRGIPYAKPPLGDLRFKAPVPPEPWSLAINATHDAPFCIQKNYFFANPKVEGKEDCLYLNIYVPARMSTTKNEKPLMPVMVFIHWGGFFAGRGSSDMIGPEYIMDRDVILVTFNYRLGVFGFFTTLDDFAPGNFGLKDQVMALKFVNENIECFGGDKNRVTLFGQSAGSGSVGLHLISPLSKGLFQQAISQSGVALNLWAKPLNILQPNVTAALANFVGCSKYIGNSLGLLKCLRKVDAVTLTESADKFKYFSTEPLTPYSIVTEKTSDANPKPFLTKDPLEYLKCGAFQKVPWIVGVVQDEGILRVAPLVRQSLTLKALNDNFNTILPKLLYLSLSAGENTTGLFENITSFYLQDKNSIERDNPNSIQGFINLYTDRSFTYGTYQSVILHSQKGHKPIWLYNFNYRGQYSYGDKFASTNENINFNWGVCHCDDLLYLFKTPALFPKLQNDNDNCMTESLLSLWTNFAIYGDPDPHRVINWTSLDLNSTEEIKNINLTFLNITGTHQDGIEFKIQKGFYPERTQFWINQSIVENFPGLF